MTLRTFKGTLASLAIGSFGLVALPARGMAQEPRVELSAWAGGSWFDGGLEVDEGVANEAGLRFAELAVWPSTHSRIWYQFDNGMTLDNFRLAEGDVSSPAHYIGGFIHYAERYITRLEVGRRELPGDVGQTLLRGEQVFLVPNGFDIRLGTWIGPREDGRTEWIVHSGFGADIGAGFRVGPTFFYSVSGLEDQSEWRILVTADYDSPDRWQVTGGFAAGQSSTVGGLDTRSVTDGFLKIGIPIGERHRIHALVRREAIGERTLQILAAGLTIGLGSRRAPEPSGPEPVAQPVEPAPPVPEPTPAPPTTCLAGQSWDSPEAVVKTLDGRWMRVGEGEPISLDNLERIGTYESVPVFVSRFAEPPYPELWFPRCDPPGTYQMYQSVPLPGR